MELGGTFGQQRMQLLEGNPSADAGALSNAEGKTAMSFVHLLRLTEDPAFWANTQRLLKMQWIPSGGI